MYKIIFLVFLSLSVFDPAYVEADKYYNIYRMIDEKACDPKGNTAEMLANIRKCDQEYDAKKKEQYAKEDKISEECKKEAADEVSRYPVQSDADKGFVLHTCSQKYRKCFMNKMDQFFKENEQEHMKVHDALDECKRKAVKLSDEEIRRVRN